MHKLMLWFAALAQLEMVASLPSEFPRILEDMATQSSCLIEDGFDYVGNDIGYAVTTKPEECCAVCRVLAGCRAFTWSDYNSGTCWFKSGRGTIVAKEGYKSAIVSTTTSTCVAEESIDYEGNDIGSIASPTASLCCCACQDYPGCRAYTFTSFNGGTCWFKSEKGRMIVNADAQSAEVYIEEPTCGLETGYNYVGNDIGNTPASTAGECCTKCKNWTGCRAFSWTNYNGGTCHFKNLKGDVEEAAGVTSAQVVANPPAPSCALEEGVDYIGNDIGTASSSEAYGCCSICLARSGCGAFSWTDFNGGTCYLKSGKGATTANSDVISSVV